MLLPASAAYCLPVMPEAPPAQLCRAAIAATERVTRIPDEFLNAISRVETGRAQGGAISPWPWTVNAAGTGHFYASKAEAVAAVRRFMAGGVRSLDVGCLQVNLFYHQDAFRDVEQAFDPLVNAAYAGKLLLGLFQQTGSWPRAAAAYHSLTPALGDAYEKKVLEAWATPDRPSVTDRSDSQARQNAREDVSAPLRPLSPEPNRGDTAASAAMAPPAYGLAHRFATPTRNAGVGKTLADYRAARIRPALPARARFGGASMVPAGVSQD